MENKRFKVYITIFVITTLIASCFAIYFAIELSNKNLENITVGKVESVATDDVDKKETNVEIKEVEKIVEKDIFEFKEWVDNSWNPTIGYLKYTEIADIKNFNVGYSTMAKITYDGKIYIRDNHSYAEPKQWIESDNEGKKPIDVKLTRLNSDGGISAAVVLMQDGSVCAYYTDSAKKIENLKIDSLKNIVQLREMTDDDGSSINLVAIDKNANIYTITRLPL